MDSSAMRNGPNKPLSMGVEHARSQMILEFRIVSGEVVISDISCRKKQENASFPQNPTSSRWNRICFNPILRIGC